MTSPQGRDRITAEEVQLAADADTAIAQFARTYSPKIAAILNDPAIRRLVVRKCVEAMTLDDLAVLVYSYYSVDEKSRKETERYVISALCGPEETPR
jgi:hypothetical protein